MDTTIYGTIDFEYDEDKRIKAVSVNGVKQLEYTYDSAGNISDSVKLFWVNTKMKNMVKESPCSVLVY
jgi:YD repeat-containing protein